MCPTFHCSLIAMVKNFLFWISLLWELVPYHGVVRHWTYITISCAQLMTIIDWTINNTSWSVYVRVCVCVSFVGQHKIQATILNDKRKKKKKKRETKNDQTPNNDLTSFSLTKQMEILSTTLFVTAAAAVAVIVVFLHKFKVKVEIKWVPFQKCHILYLLCGY